MSATLQARQIAALQAAVHSLPTPTRMFINGGVIILTLCGQDLKPGVPDAPTDQDINAAIGQLMALKRAAAKARNPQPTLIVPQPQPEKRGPVLGHAAYRNF